MVRCHALLIIALTIIERSSRSLACTVIAAGKGATHDGSVMVTHTDDQSSSTADLRVVRVPGASHPKNATRAVYLPVTRYPRVVTSERGEDYKPKEGETEWIPLGTIPQIEKTNAYFDQDFAFMNMHQVVIAETTVAAKTAGWPLTLEYGYNMMSMEELTKIAMERCATARCAVQTMGDLAVEYGYYAIGTGNPAKPAYGGAAEAVAVGDKNEAWMMHIITGPNNASAVWAAARVPDNEVAVMANAMVIREMDLDDPDNFLASDNVHSFAIEQGWWDPKAGPFDFTAAYAYDASCSKLAYEFPTNALYAGRRMWRAFDLMAPSMNLDPKLGWIPFMKTYPFSVTPDEKLTAASLMTILRDTFNGTQFDLSQGIKGGPFNSPLQYDPPHYDNYTISGGWERPIAIYRMLYSFVAICRSWLPDHIGGKVLLALGRSTTSVYVPFYSGHSIMPESYLLGKESELSPKSTWWAFAFVANFAQLKWSLMWPDIRAEQHRLESIISKGQEEAESKALEIYREDGADASLVYLQDFSNARAQEVTEAWWKLGFALVTKFRDGFITNGEAASRPRPGYPKSWLVETGEYIGWPWDTFTDQRTPDMCDGDIPGAAKSEQAAINHAHEMQATQNNRRAELIGDDTVDGSVIATKLAAVAAVAAMAGSVIGFIIARMGTQTQPTPATLQQPLLL